MLVMMVPRTFLKLVRFKSLKKLGQNINCPDDIWDKLHIGMKSKDSLLEQK